MDKKFLKIYNKLCEYYGVFAKIYEVGRVSWILDPKIPTAAVTFNMEGNFLSFLFNEEFYNSLSEDELAAVICHECMHVILNHGIRLQTLTDKQLANVCMDAVINGMLVSDFGFDRNMKVFNKAYFLDVLERQSGLTLEKNKNFEYYYSMIINSEEALKRVKDGMGGASGCETIDSHESLPTYSDGRVEKIVNGLSEREKNILDEKKKGSLTNKDELIQSKDKAAGNGSSFTWSKLQLENVPRVRWEENIKGTIIKKFRERQQYQWRRENRRMSLISQKQFLIPMEQEVDDSNKLVDAVFFVDVSGSCHSYVPKFVSAANQIPKKFFNVEAYAFDDDITPVKLTDKEFPMGGGTSFHQLEELLLRRKRYPQIVFVMTDGLGTTVNPKYPHRWNVYLTNHSSRECFPNKVKFYELGF